jgi:hypothetical protein
VHRQNPHLQRTPDRPSALLRACGGFFVPFVMWPASRTGLRSKAS